ncbi:MAG TPA: VOC family protein [Arsenicitalea sp.]|jgi:predicted enzyme related to lactoylglutathione lyase|nr:VOC family protein [Arsenicitalea sp.]
MSQSFQIDYLEFPSSNGRRSRDFFEEAFGWRFTEYGPHYNAIDDAGIAAGIQSDPAEATTAPLAIVRTDDLEKAEQRVVAAGGTVTQPAFDFPGGRRFHFREPGGNELAVWIAKE